MSNRYRLLLAASLLGSLALAAPAFAQTTPQATGHMGMVARGGMARSGVFGTVASVNGNTLTVTSRGWSGKSTSATPTPTAVAPTTYTVDATNATVTKNGTASSVSGIAIGDTVMVQGTVSGTSITATAIRDGVPAAHAPGAPKPSPVIQGNGEPVIAGTITAINGGVLTVSNKSNVTYTVDATSATISIKNAKSTLGSVAVGNSVVIQGTVNGTSVTATSVVDQGTPKVRSATTTTATTTASANSANSGSKGSGGFFGSIGSFFKHLFGF